MKALRTVVVLAAVLSTLILGATHKKARAMTTPNVVLILTDDQRWDTVDATHGLDGNPVMPIVMNELANSGVTFSNAFVTTAVCCPSRASILTGKYAHNHGVLKNVPPNGGAGAFEDTETLATILHDAGYRTGLVGKYLNGYEALSPYIPPGWDDWRVFVNDPAYFNYDLNENGTIIHYGSTPPEYATDVLAAKACDFIASAQQPFFLYFAPSAPHSPFTPAPRHAGMFAGLPSWTPPNLNEPNVSDKPPWLQAMPKLTKAVRAKIDANRKAYLEMLQAVDEAVGLVVNALEVAGVKDETLIVFAGDNSYMWGEHRLRAKDSPYEEAMRVPLIVRYPPLAGALPRAEAGLALNVDLLPTILEVAGLPVPSDVNGASLVPLLIGNAQTWRTEALCEHWAVPTDHQHVPDNALVRNAQFKYIEYTDVGQGTELYDLAADPFELVNRTNDSRMALAKIDLAARLQALKAE